MVGRLGTATTTVPFFAKTGVVDWEVVVELPELEVEHAAVLVRSASASTRAGSRLPLNRPNEATARL